MPLPLLPLLLPLLLLPLPATQRRLTRRHLLPRMLRMNPGVPIPHRRPENSREEAKRHVVEEEK